MRAADWDFSPHVPPGSPTGATFASGRIISSNHRSPDTRTVNPARRRSTMVLRAQGPSAWDLRPRGCRRIVPAGPDKSQYFSRQLGPSYWPPAHMRRNRAHVFILKTVSGRRRQSGRRRGVPRPTGRSATGSPPTGPARTSGRGLGGKYRRRLLRRCAGHNTIAPDNCTATGEQRLTARIAAEGTARVATMEERRDRARARGGKARREPADERPARTGSIRR